MRFCLVLAILTTLGCASRAVQTPPIDGMAPLSESDYRAVIKKNTAKTNQYSGLYQTFQADLTMLNSEVLTATLRQRAQFLQWDQKQFQLEREKALQENSAYAKFFMRFFIPDNEYDDLHKGKTIWRIYLEVNGQRFDGKVKKMTEKYAELSTIFPNLDHFSTAYEVTFSVPMTTLENTSCKVTLASSLGSADFVFPVKK